MPLRNMFSRAWIVTTLLVFAGTAVCIRLGIWQLDRLEQRRAFNRQVNTMRAMPALDLNAGIPFTIVDMEWRKVKVTGRYDFENQFAIRNQVLGNEYGFHLITPLRFEGGAILVNRGFIPASTNSSTEHWRQYDIEGEVTVTGQIRLGNDVEIGGNPETRDASRYFNSISVEKIAAQLSYPILPVYIQPDEMENAAPPVPQQPELNLTEGSHFGYALQWFTFAVILFFGYPFYLTKSAAVA